MNTLKILQYSIFLFVGIAISTAQTRTDPSSQPTELGKVSWYRDYDQALKSSKESGKPVLILFQEVPGCSTCQNYGKDVLSNPLMTEVIENEFVPLAIYNNKGGDDRKILEKYTESAWNNPVVNIINSNGDKMVKRVAGNYTAVGLYSAMKEALVLYNKEIPTYMKLLGEELHASKTSQVDRYYSMYCFWTGEKELGSQIGVLNTEAGFMKGHEVVKVTYDSAVINNKNLDQFAGSRDMKTIGVDKSYYASSKDEDYYLKHSEYKYLPLSKLQRTKINSALGMNKRASQFLSPKQYKRYVGLRSAQHKVVLFDKDFQSSWYSLVSN